MAGPVPYVARPYDNRRHAAVMSDLIGRRGDIATEAAYNRSLGHASMVGDVGRIVGEGLQQYAQVKAVKQEKQRVENEKQALKDTYKKISALPEEQRVDELVAAGYPDEARQLAQLQTAKAQERHARYQLDQQQWGNGLSILAGIEKRPPEQRTQLYAEALPELTKLAGPQFSNLLPQVYDPNFYAQALNMGKSQTQILEDMRIADEKALQAKQRGQSAFIAAAPQLASMTARVKGQEQFDAVLRFADEVGAGAEFRRVIGETYGDDTMQKFNAVLAPLLPQPKAPDLKDAELLSFAKGRGYASPTEMKEKDWAEWHRNETNRAKEIAAAGRAPRTPETLNPINARSEATEWVKEARIEYDNEMTRIDEATGEEWTPAAKTAARKAAADRRDGEIRRANAWYADITSGGAGGRGKMSDLVLPPSQTGGMRGFGIQGDVRLPGSSAASIASFGRAASGAPPAPAPPPAPVFKDPTGRYTFSSDAIRKMSPEERAYLQGRK